VEETDLPSKLRKRGRGPAFRFQDVFLGRHDTHRNKTHSGTRRRSKATTPMWRR